MDGRTYTLTPEAAKFLWNMRRPDIPDWQLALDLADDQVWVITLETKSTGVPYKMRRRADDTYVPLLQALKDWLPA